MSTNVASPDGNPSGKGSDGDKTSENASSRFSARTSGRGRGAKTSVRGAEEAVGNAKKTGVKKVCTLDLEDYELR